jgi:hypothetical protein
MQMDGRESRLLAPVTGKVEIRWIKAKPDRENRRLHPCLSPFIRLKKEHLPPRTGIASQIPSRTSRNQNAEVTRQESGDQKPNAPLGPIPRLPRRLCFGI